jgi:hypothetical protein
MSADHPAGLALRDAVTGREMLLVSEPGHIYWGWLLYRHPDGDWVTLRKATAADQVRIARALEVGRAGEGEGT